MIITVVNTFELEEKTQKYTDLNGNKKSDRFFQFVCLSYHLSLLSISKCCFQKLRLKSLCILCLANSL